VEVTGEYTFVFTFRDGKLVRWQMFTDEAEALEVAGAPVYG
jgi:ketosteroid isomerase-like protein